VHELRRLAESLPGDRPTSIRFERIMDFKIPRAITITSGPLSRLTMAGAAYQIAYPDQHTVIVDTAMSSDQAKALGTINAFNEGAYARLIKAMSAAQMILITHEHPDHIGGLAAHPDVVHLFQTNVKLTKEQASNLEFSKPVVLPEAALTGYQPLVYDRLMAIAPGIVLIKSPGHSPGSQMVFVHQSDRTDFLFLGDIAWTMPNVDLVRGRPRLIGLITHEDRQAVIDQLAAIHALAAANPKLVIVPGHDAGTLADLAARGVMKERFE